MKTLLSCLPGILIPITALAHGVGEHHHDEAQYHVGPAEVAIGLGVIAAIAVVWAVAARKK